MILLNSVVSACQRAARWQAAFDLATCASEWLLQADIVSYNSAAAACAAASPYTWQAALSILMYAEGRSLQPDTRSFTAILQGCVATGQWEAALVLLDCMLEREVMMDAFACGAAVGACWGQWEWALHILFSACDAKSGPGNWQVPAATAMDICSRAGRWESALSILQYAGRVFTPNVVVFGAAMSALERGSMWRATQQLLDRMKSSVVAPNVYVYTAALNSLEKAGNWELVFAMLEDMKGMTVTPTSVTYDVLVRACRNYPGWQAAVHIVYALMPDSGIVPTARSTNALLGVLEAELQWGQSIHILNSVSTKDIASFSIAASTCEKSSAWQEAVAICGQAEGTGLQADEVSLGVLISAWEKGSGWQMAIMTLTRMFQEFLQPGDISVAAALRACQAAGRWQSALCLFGMTSSWPALTAGLCNPVLGACASGQQWERALYLFLEATSASLQPDMVTLTTVMSACEAGLKWQQAVAVLDGALTARALPDATACNVAISSCAKVLNWRAALSLLNGLGEPSRSWPDVVSYNAVLGSCKQQESWLQALILLQDMLEKSIVPNLTTFHGVLEACATGHAWELSISCLHEMTTSRLSSLVAMNLVASACQQAAEYQVAESVLANVLACAPPASCSDPVTLRMVLDVAEAGFVGEHVIPCMDAFSSWAQVQLSMPQCTQSRVSDMQGASQAVVAAEILQWHGRIDAQFWSQFVHVVEKPVTAQLQRLCRPELQHERHQARLQNAILERQFGLSPIGTEDVLSGFDMLGSDTWLGCPRSSTRRCSVSRVSIALDPTSKHLAAWASWVLRLGPFTRLASCSFASGSRCHGYTVADDAKPLLRPVQVQHDRRPHAERQLLEFLACDAWSVSANKRLLLFLAPKARPQVDSTLKRSR